MKKLLIASAVLATVSTQAIDINILTLEQSDNEFELFAYTMPLTTGRWLIDGEYTPFTGNGFGVEGVLGVNLFAPYSIVGSHTITFEGLLGETATPIQFTVQKLRLTPIV